MLTSTPSPQPAPPDPELSREAPSKIARERAQARLRQIATAPWSERLSQRPSPCPQPPRDGAPPSASHDTAAQRLAPYLQADIPIQWDPLGVAIAPTPVFSQGMLANAYFFGHPRWGRRYAQRAHQGASFRDRWQAALRQHNPNGWDGQVVVDLGCGAGTLWERLGGEPAEIIGVDISLGALHWAQTLGYAGLRADVHHLPLQSGCADIVVANALLHHCDQVTRVLSEAARLVKPGGLLITDLDPQYSAWQRRGWGLWLHQQSGPGRGQSLGQSLGQWLRDEAPHPDERAWQLATELHNRQPNQGLQPALFHSLLGSLGFEVAVYPHNSSPDGVLDSNDRPGVGAELFEGRWGRAPFKTGWEQRLSGLNPNQLSSARSLLCLARRRP